MLSHNVFFTLNDNSVEAKAQLVAACKQFLSDHPGTIFFAVGSLAAEFDRTVNDRQFDVALHVVFEDKAAHDAYQDSASHGQFIGQAEDNWKAVRVFDSYVEQ